MINGKDLRIGNLLLFSQRKCEVIGIRKDTKYSCYTLSLNIGNDTLGVNLDFFDCKTVSHIFFKDGIIYPAREITFCGIPITEKILIDSGFTCDSKKYMLGKLYILKIDFIEVFRVIISDTGKNYFYTRERIPCNETKYIHNLQNAYLQATGKDLDLVINDYSNTIP